MKLKKGYVWKSIEGPSKGKEFVIVDVASDSIQYKSKETGQFYEESRKNFEKRIQRVNEYWSSTTKEYKMKKENLRNTRDS